MKKRALQLLLIVLLMVLHLSVQAQTSIISGKITSADTFFELAIV